MTPESRRTHQRKRARNVHPPRDERRREQVLYKREKRAKSGWGRPGWNLGYDKDPSMWDDKECGARLLIKGREQVCLCVWVNGDNDLLLPPRLAYPRQHGAKFGASWIITACNAPPRNCESMIHPFQCRTHSWSVHWKISGIGRGLGSWELPLRHSHSIIQHHLRINVQHARTHAHTHTHSPTHPTHQSISTRTYLLTHHVPKTSFLHTISVFLCVSLWVSLSVCVCLCLSVVSAVWLSSVCSLYSTTFTSWEQVKNTN
jgi:hypothetical protein